MTKSSYSRRKFFQVGALTIPAFSILPQALLGQRKQVSQQNEWPVMISTWDHGEMANNVGYKMLQEGKAVIDAVEAGVIVVESDPTTRTVGIGGYPDREGIVTLDACIMKGDGSCGAVAFLQDIKNPISVARKVMETTEHVMLAGKGAKNFAIANGFKEENLLTIESKKDYEKWLNKSKYKPTINIENHDTISALAIDQNGLIAGACTTSGAAYKMHGRVGDSPIIGAGLFVDEEVGAACATGLGEEVIRTAGSAMVVELMRNGATPQEACEEMVKRIIRKTKLSDLQIGFLALDKYGRTGAYSVTKGFTYALSKGDQSHLLKSNYEID